MTFKDKLKQLYTECSVEDWDGYNALPLSHEAVLIAEKLVEQLLDVFPELETPDLVPMPDGDLGLTWGYYKKGKYVHIYIDEEKIVRCLYADKGATNHIWFGYVEEENESQLNEKLKDVFNVWLGKE